MLAYVLALAVGLGSLAIYMAAFFFPEVHRKNDFIWSGVGLFYALVLWVCAGRITGALLLGQVASVALLGWSVTQTLLLRRTLTPQMQQTIVPNAEQIAATVGNQASKLSLSQRFSQLSKSVGASANTAKNRIQQNLGGRKTPKPSTKEAAPTTAFAATPTATTGEAIRADAQASATAPPIPKSDTSPPESLSVQVIDNRTWTPEVTPLPKESPLGAEPDTKTPQPAGPDMPGPSGKESIPVEEIAPEVELAPPAEPIGSGDPQDRQNPPPPPVAMEAVPIEVPQTEPSPSSESESSSQEDVAEPVRPHPPDPELVEAAIHDAEEKGLEASPPENQ